MINHKFIDKEFCHTYLYQNNINFSDFKLQEEEVAGIFKAKLNSLCAFFKDEIETIRIEGYILNDSGDKIWMDKTVDKEAFVPHEPRFFKEVARLLSEQSAK